jgi:hypothetical protein
MSVKKGKHLHQPRIELGAQRWQRWILPLNHWCCCVAGAELDIMIIVAAHSCLYPDYFCGRKALQLFLLRPYIIGR